jgi:hypothetical protein
VVRSQSEPRAEVLHGGEFAHVCADLGEDGLGNGRRDPRDGHEIHAYDARQMRAHIIAGLVLRLRSRLDPRQRPRGRVAFKPRLHRRKLLLDPGIAGGKLVRVEVESGSRLLENEHLRIAPRAGEGFGEVVFGRRAGRVAQLC